MKKILTLFLALCMAFALCACGGERDEQPAADENAPALSPAIDGSEEPDDGAMKVGLVCIGDENSGYDLAHITGLSTAAENVGLPAENVICRYNIPADETCYNTITDLIDLGCDIVFTDFYGHQEFAYMAAIDHPDTVVVAVTGDFAWTAGLDNFKNASCRIYESCYVSGVAAGMKLQEMLANGQVAETNYDADGNIKLGYVATTPGAEMISGYTAFYLGAKSIVENVVMDVIYTGELYDLTAEADAASALIDGGCCIIGCHTNSNSVAVTVQTAQDGGLPVYCVGYTESMLSSSPTAALTSVSCDWSVFYTDALQCMLDGTELPTDWCEGYAAGASRITPFGTSCAADTDTKVAEVEAAIADGSLQVFDTASFTVDGKTVTSVAALDSDGDFIADTGEAIVDGAFQESTLRSAPYFTLLIDGITVITPDPVPPTAKPL